MIIWFIPFVAITWFLYYVRSNNLNNPLVGLIFFSYLFFATNYTNYGLDLSFDIFRSLHRFIGVVCIGTLLLHLYKYKTNVFNDDISKLLLIFMLVLLMSIIGNDVYFQNYFHYVRNFVFISLIVLFVYYKVDTHDKLDELFKLISLATLLLSFFVLFEVLSNGVVPGGDRYNWGANRSSLFYSNPNYLAIALLPGFTLLILSQNKYWQILSILVLVSIFATGSRAAELSVVFVLLLFIFKNMKQFNKVYLSIFIFAIISVTTLFFDKIVTDPVSTLTGGRVLGEQVKHKGSVRLDMAKISFNAFIESPINGIGYGQFRTKYYQYIDGDFIESHKLRSIRNAIDDGLVSFDESITDTALKSKGLRRHLELMTHNDLLTIIAELGLLGLVFLTFVFYKLYIELKKILLYSRENYFLSIGLICGSLIFSMFHNNLTSFVFWFILFIPFIMNRNYKKQLEE
jgi:O-antigen ligase